MTLIKSNENWHRLLEKYDLALTILFLHLSFLGGYFYLFLENRFNNYSYREFQRAESVIAGILPIIGPDTQSGWYLPGPFLNLFNAATLLLGANFFTFNLFYFYLIYVGVFLFALTLKRLTGVSLLTLAILINCLSLVQNSYLFLNNSTLVFPFAALVLYFSSRLSVFSDERKVLSGRSILVLIFLSSLGLNIHASFLVLVGFFFLCIGGLPAAKRISTLAYSSIIFIAATSTFWLSYLFDRYSNFTLGPVFHSQQFGHGFHLTTQLFGNLEVLREFQWSEVLDKLNSRKIESLILLLLLLATTGKIFQKRASSSRPFAFVQHAYLLLVGAFLLLLNVRSNSVHYLVAWAVLALTYCAYHNANCATIKLLAQLRGNGRLVLFVVFASQFFLTKISNPGWTAYSPRDYQAVCAYFNREQKSFWEVRLNSFEIMSKHADSSFILGAYCFKEKGKITDVLAGTKNRYLFLEKELLREASFDHLLADAASEIRQSFADGKAKKILETPRMAVFTSDNGLNDRPVFTAGTSDPYQMDSGLTIRDNLERWTDLKEYFGGLPNTEVYSGRICDMPMFCSVYLLAKKTQEGVRLAIIAKPLAWNKDPPLTFYAKDFALISQCGEQIQKTEISDQLGYDKNNLIRNTVFAPIFIPKAGDCPSDKRSYKLAFGNLRIADGLQGLTLYKDIDNLVIELARMSY